MHMRDVIKLSVLCKPESRPYFWPNFFVTLCGASAAIGLPRTGGNIRGGHAQDATNTQDSL